MGVKIFMLSAVMLLSRYYHSKAQPTVSGDYPQTCDNMLQCQHQITQLDKKVANMESHMEAVLKVLEVLDSRTISILKKLLQLTIIEPQSRQLNGTVNYEIMTSPKDWQSARDDCSSRGGDLVVIESLEEWAYLYNHFYQNEYHNQCPIFWTSGQKRGDKWVWANGGQEIDLPWPENQPSGDGSCVDLLRYEEYDYEINDAACSHRLCYVCEYQ